MRKLLESNQHKHNFEFSPGVTIFALRLVESNAFCGIDGETSGSVNKFYVAQSDSMSKRGLPDKYHRILAFLPDASNFLSQLRVAIPPTINSAYGLILLVVGYVFYRKSYD